MHRQNKNRNHILRSSFPPLRSGQPLRVTTKPFSSVISATRPVSIIMGRQKDEDGDVVIPVDHWICSVLKVICIVRTGAGNEHSYLIEYVAHGENAPRRSLLSQALLLGRPEEPLKALRDFGVSVLYVNTKAVRSYLDLEHMRFSEKTPDDFWRSVPVVGWEQAPTCFVLPSETLGNHSGVWFSGKCDGTIYSKRVALMTGRTTSRCCAKTIPSRFSR